MDEAYAQSLIDWMDTDCGLGMSYRAWFDQQNGAAQGSAKGAQTNDGPVGGGGGTPTGGPVTAPTPPPKPK